ncbi:hypothetical protein VOLCADRAFT_91454 [Volvox carteri f. nagariensis]|uniref:protein-serine/threonine phosphatase n=1 Tax=Volvox carteri f. nagariensis TaxID=3068 RepID=D8TX46_VOLCA|nr:uncharacterized protein VOLCADRAFT_91454 [Volvox carteri f. nagariensis]EFJ47947.1 hypothetical protein VOLCADRAFT_91454 [Volvox carteri f. nagariensis]|eukprot:XP_002951053.1 hypothetical protein VOLCADRAFT_91454 [Volvox carteri f. nagariensis]
MSDQGSPPGSLDDELAAAFDGEFGEDEAEEQANDDDGNIPKHDDEGGNSSSSSEVDLDELGDQGFTEIEALQEDTGEQDTRLLAWAASGCIYIRSFLTRPFRLPTLPVPPLIGNYRTRFVAPSIIPSFPAFSIRNLKQMAGYHPPPPKRQRVVRFSDCGGAGAASRRRNDGGGGAAAAAGTSPSASPPTSPCAHPVWVFGLCGLCGISKEAAVEAAVAAAAAAQADAEYDKYGQYLGGVAGVGGSSSGSGYLAVAGAVGGWPAAGGVRVGCWGEPLVCHVALVGRRDRATCGNLWGVSVHEGICVCTTMYGGLDELRNILTLYNAYSLMSYMQSGVVRLKHLHASKEVEVSTDEADRIRRETVTRLLSRRRLILILDLDHTLLNSVHTSEVGPDTATQLAEVLRREEEANLGPRRLLHRLAENKLWTKLRPGVFEFLEGLRDDYEMHIYTMGDKTYAAEVRKLLDPTGKLFSSVIAKDHSTTATAKDLDVLLSADELALVLDDTEAVWPGHRRNLLQDSDESATDGALAAHMRVLRAVHTRFFSADDPSLPPLERRDVRDILSEQRREILQLMPQGCCITFSRCWPQDRNPLREPLWQLAMSLGANCLTTYDPGVTTHVVAAAGGTEKGCAHRWTRLPEEDFAVPELPSSEGRTAHGPSGGCRDVGTRRLSPEEELKAALTSAAGGGGGGGGGQMAKHE